MTIYTILLLHIDCFRHKLEREKDQTLLTISNRNVTFYDYFNNNIRFPMKYVSDHIGHMSNEQILESLKEIDFACSRFKKFYVNKEDSEHVPLLLTLVGLYFEVITNLKVSNLGKFIENMDKNKFEEMLKRYDFPINERSLFFLEYPLQGSHFKE